MWTLNELFKQCNSCRTEINGKWVPSRPINWKYRTLAERLKQSWAVFTGKADLFKWPEGQ